MGLTFPSPRLTGAAIFAALWAGMAQADPAGIPYAGHYGMMGWSGWIFGPLMMLLFFALLVGAAVLLIRLLGGDLGRPGAPGGDRAQEILRERFARGEIGREEFEAARAALNGGRA